MLGVIHMVTSPRALSTTRGSMQTPMHMVLLSLDLGLCRYLLEGERRLPRSKIRPTGLN